MVGGSFAAPICSMIWSACPELRAGAASPVIDAAGQVEAAHDLRSAGSRARPRTSRALKRFKSFTYAEPRYACSVANTLSSGIPSVFTFVRSTSA
jgi:hypothetical protein